MTYLMETHGTSSCDQSAVDFDAVLGCLCRGHPGMNPYDPVAAIEMLNADEDARDPGASHRIQPHGWCTEPTSGIRWFEGWTR